MKNAIEGLLEVAFSVAEKLDLDTKFKAIQHNGKYVNGADDLYNEKFAIVEGISKGLNGVSK